MSGNLKSRIRDYVSILILILFVPACKDAGFDRAGKLIEQGKRLEAAGYPDSALVVYRQAVEVLKNTENDTLSGVIYNRMGSLMFDNTLRVEAYEYYGQALAYNLKIKDKTEASRTLRGLGKVWLFKGRQDSAVFYFKEALSFSPQISDKEEASLIHNNLSAVFFDLGEFRKSLLHNSKAIQLSGDPVNMDKNLFSRGDLFAETHQYDSAFFYYKLSSKSAAIYTRAGSYYRLAQLAKLTGSKDSARYLDTYQQLKDTIDRANKSADILKVDSKYLLSRTKEDEKSKFRYYMLGVLAIVAAVTFVFIRLRRRQKNNFDQTIKGLYAEMSKLKNELSEAIKNKQIQQELLVNEQIKAVQANTVKTILRSGDKFAKKFQESVAYKELRKKLDAGNCILLEKDEKMYRTKVMDAFSPYLFYLTTFFELTSDECYYCCLSLLKFKTSECAICRNVSEEAIRTQKKRIKIKICTTTETESLFNHIFRKTK